MAGNVCDVCNREEKPVVGVCSSGLGPISWAYCQECLENGSEPESMMWYLRDIIGVKDLHPALMKQLTFVDGKYITFEDWVALEKPTLPEPPEDDTVWPEDTFEDFP